METPTGHHRVSRSINKVNSGRSRYMSMKTMYATMVSLLLFVSISTTANEYYTFTASVIEAYHDLDASSDSFCTIDSPERFSLIKMIDSYNARLQLDVKSIIASVPEGNQEIARFADQMKSLLSDVQKNNSDLKMKLINSATPDERIVSLYQECKGMDRLALHFMQEITMGYVTVLVKDRPEGVGRDKQYLKLTARERESLINRLVELFGPQVKEMKPSRDKTPFFGAANILCTFLMLEWVCEEE